MKMNDDIPRIEAGEKIKIDIDFENLKIRKKRRFPYFVLILVLVVLLIMLFLIFKDRSKSENDKAIIDVISDNVTVWQGAFESKEIFDACQEASVSIIAEGRKCSGFVYSSDGWIATVEGIVNEDVKGKIEVVLFDGRRFFVEAFRQNRESGLILMKINADGIRSVSFNDSSRILAGEELFTFCSIGEFDEGGSLFSGKIAHTQRMVEVKNNGEAVRTLNLFQIGILLTEEGVGAPLFNKNGELVGISCVSSAYGERDMIDYAFEFSRVKMIFEAMKCGKRANESDVSLIVVK